MFSSALSNTSWEDPGPRADIDRDTFAYDRMTGPKVSRFLPQSPFRAGLLEGTHPLRHEIAICTHKAQPLLHIAAGQP